MSYKSIRIYSASFENLNELSKKYNCSKTELIEAMTRYFLTNGISPFEQSDVTTEVKKLKNQLISFIRNQESKKINPMINKVDIIVQSVAEHINKKPLNNTKELITKLAQFINEKHEKELLELNKILNEIEDIKTQANKKGGIFR